MPPLIIIDVPNLSYRNHYALAGKSEFRMPICFGMLRDISNLSANLFSNDFVFCFDHSHCLRMEVYPNYKISRRNNPERRKIQKEIEIVREDLLPMIGYQNLLCVDGAEADDLMAVVVKSTQKDCWLVTSDSDLYQLLDDQVRIWNPATRIGYTASQFVKDRKARPKEWAGVKSITGCKSDNIEGVDGVGPVTAIKFMRGTLDFDSQRYKRIMANAAITASNLELIKLPYCKLNLGKWALAKDEIDPRAWDAAAMKFDLLPMLGKCPRDF